MRDKGTLQKKRQQAREMYREQNLKKAEIARKLGMSRKFVHKWSKDTTPVETDNRGWPKGKRRKYTEQEENRIIKIRKELEEKDFFHGAGKILDKYKQQFPNSPEVHKSYIKRIINQHFPMSRRKPLKAVEKQNYPIEAIASLGDIQEEADYLGQKFIHGRTEPIHFLTRVYKKPFTLRLIHRVPNQCTETIMDTFTRDWKEFPLPDVLSIDNGFGFTAAGTGKRYISRFIQYLLHLGVAPLLIAPKKPWMNGAVEGTHSVFARKVWNKYDFSTLGEIDDTVARFQNAYREYSKTPKSLPGRTLDESFSWKDIFLKPFSQKEGMVIFLIRLVENHTRGNSEIPAIRLFRDIVELEKVYLNQYVLAELDVFKGQLNIHIQPYREDLQLIKQVDFPVKMATSR